MSRRGVTGAAAAATERPRISAMGSGGEAGGWTEAATERLADAGYRRGGARAEVLTLMGAQQCALSALEIEEQLAAGERRVSRASIYRILEELEQVRMIQRVDVGSGTARFEPVRQGHGHHHHLICDECGRLEPFSDEQLEQAISALSARVPHVVTEHEVVLHGACRDCLS